jgi:uncharacterized repeat protein (TIGR01451 family)
MHKRVLIGLSTFITVTALVASTGTVLAWHPKGQIKKSVQNVTTQSAVSDANDAKSAVTVKTGDTLKYVVEVSNTGAAADNGMNDMHDTVMTDTLPAGVELVSNPNQSKISENLGTLKPGQKVTKEYTVRVTANKDKQVVDNEACFTGDSAVKDAPQKGCDHAVVVLTVPEVPKTPITPTAPEQPKGQGSAPQVSSAVTTLPETGAGGVVAIFAGVSVLGYAGHLVVSRKRQ